MKPRRVLAADLVDLADPVSYRHVEVDDQALTVAHLAVENVLVEFRDRGISTLEACNGLVVKSRDGELSDAIRLGTREGLEVGIKAYLAAVDAIDAAPAHEFRALERPDGRPIDRCGQVFSAPRWCGLPAEAHPVSLSDETDGRAGD